MYDDLEMAEKIDEVKERVKKIKIPKQHIRSVLEYAAKVAQFTVEHGVTITMALMFIMHATLMFVMFYYQIFPLVKINGIGAVLYMIGVLTSMFNYKKPAFIIMLLEVPVYTYLSVYYVGWNSGCAQYLLAFVPALVYFGDMLFSGAKKLISIIFTIGATVLYIWLYMYSYDTKQLVLLKPIVSHTLFIINAILADVLISIFCIVYVIMLESNRQGLIKKNTQLKNEIVTDPLTGLMNRRGFLPIVEKLIATKRRFCIAFCDIDNFKKVNDSYGHDAGDEILKLVAGIIKKEAKNCIVCRWGGEEMVVLMIGYNLGAAVKRMNHIREIIEKTPKKFYKRIISVTITTGISEYNAKYGNADKVIKVADERMYYGKQHGKNRVVYK